MGADITPEAIGPTTNGYRVTCSTHALNRLVLTPEHAANLQRLHDRQDHADDTPPETFDISAAALAVLVEARTPGQGTALEGALEVWRALTGAQLDGVAFDLARDYADSPTTAHPAPF